MKRARGLVIGSHDDVHVRSVLECMTKSLVLVMDVESLSESQFVYKDSLFQIETPSGWFEISGDVINRGWFRRLAPPNWQQGIQVGSRVAAEKTAWLSLMGALSRLPHVEWLTDIDDALISENKLRQHAIAKQIGIRTPHTIVSNVASEVISELPDDRIIKPLGPGHFIEGEIPHVLYTQAVNESDLFDLRGSPPMLLQERLEAQAHLRVVVVRNQVWAASLAGDGLPIDWRSDDAAHYSFEEITTPHDVQMGALKINAALRLGYSSQDWIVTRNGAFLVDVNPSGQWLFLPEKIASAVSHAIAQWLDASYE
ncbi:MAG: hypothetical protein WA090_05310 [Candidatus Nanopelagicaceae bacterium]